MIVCPCCGHKWSEKRKHLKRPRGHKRLPNGFGSITELKDRNLRKPFLARVTIGKTPEGRQVIKNLKPEAYFKTYNDAYAALLKYSENPYDLDQNITVKQLFDRWTSQVYNGKSTRHLEFAFAYCSDLLDMNVRDIRARHIKHCIEHGSIIPISGPGKGERRTASPGTKDKIKSLWNGLLDYAMEYELIDKNYAKSFSLSSGVYEEMRKNKRAHLAFTQEELVRLWSLIKTEPVAKLIIIQSYTGMRPNELFNVNMADVELKKSYITGGSKTEAGKNRIIPIHSLIRPLVKSYYNEAKKLNLTKLFNTTDSRSKYSKPIPWNYGKYSNEFRKLMEKYHFDLNHRPHDPRKTFITEAKRFGVDDNVIKIVVGHTITDLTEAVYTQRDPEWLVKDIEKIKFPK